MRRGSAAGQGNGAHGPASVAPAPALVEVGAIVRAAATRFRERWPSRELHCRVDDTHLPVDGDPVLLRRALENLVDNARKYSDRDKPITIEVRAPRLVDFQILLEGRLRGDAGKGCACPCERRDKGCNLIEYLILFLFHGYYFFFRTCIPSNRATRHQSTSIRRLDHVRPEPTTTRITTSPGASSSQCSESTLGAPAAPVFPR
jgi:hypothetical protein